MEIPASDRLFMGHRHVARIAIGRSISLLVVWHTGRMTVPQGRLLQDDPSPSSNTAAMVSHGDRRRDDIVVSCIRVAAGAKAKEQVRRV